jgi:hypothetical protein
VLWKNKKWALFTATSVSITLLGISGIRSFERTEQHQLNFYSIKNQPAIEFRKGQKSVLIADNKLLRDDDAMLFHIRHNLWAGGIHDLREIPIDSSFTLKNLVKQRNIIDANGARVLLLKTAADTNLFSLNPDYILVTGNISPPKQITPSSKVILGNGVSKNVSEKWQSLGEHIHDLAAENALLIKLNKR